MCHYLDLLARHSQRHYITQCEHGTVHLTWEQTSIQLHPHTLLRLVEALPEWTTPADVLAAGHVQIDNLLRLVPISTCELQLWLNQTGLLLSPVDILILGQLLQTATQQMSRIERDTSHQTTTIPLRTTAGHTARCGKGRVRGFCHELVAIPMDTVSAN